MAEQARAQEVNLPGALPPLSAEELRLDASYDDSVDGDGGDLYAEYMRGVGELDSTCAHCHRRIPMGETYSNRGNYKLHKACEQQRRAMGYW